MKKTLNINKDLKMKALIKMMIIKNVVRVKETETLNE